VTAAIKRLRMGVGRPYIRHSLMVASAIFLIWVWQFVVVAGSHVDADAYRLIDSHNPYLMSSAGNEHAFLYSPAVAQLLAIVDGVPQPVFYGLLAGLSLGSLVYLLGVGWGAAILLVPVPFLWQDLLTGNIHLVLAAAVVMSFRWPATWAIVFLTKVTPGIGLIWFAVRREWRRLAIALGATAAIVAASFALTPSVWFDWVRVLTLNAGGPVGGLSVPIPLVVRLPAAVLLVVWGARTNRPWTVPMAGFLSLPIIWIWDGFAMLTGTAAVILRPELAGRRINWKAAYSGKADS
jgi:Glycosyltransferase family 87